MEQKELSRFLDGLQAMRHGQSTGVLTLYLEDGRITGHDRCEDPGARSAVRRVLGNFRPRWRRPVPEREQIPA